MTKAIALVALFFLFPILIVLIVLIKFSSKGSYLFKQKRLGKEKKEFIIYKFRTMIEDAENLKQKYVHLNEASGPVFKIKNDPRYTKVGKIISSLGLDELPQLINVIKGEMVFVGPRPLPVKEAGEIPLKYERRFCVLPGITSLWVVKGGHSLSFKKWMNLDMYYITHKSFWLDFIICLRTIWIFFIILVSKSQFR